MAVSNPAGPPPHMTKSAVLSLREVVSTVGAWVSEVENKRLVWTFRDSIVAGTNASTINVDNNITNAVNIVVVKAFIFTGLQRAKIMIFVSFPLLLLAAENLICTLQV